MSSDRTTEIEAILGEILDAQTLAIIGASAKCSNATPATVIRDVMGEWAKQKLLISEQILSFIDKGTPQKQKAAVVRSMPKRRREVFEASGGKCHYCGCELDPSGKWHIEHKMPKALMGSNEKSNLVAACVPCNLSKSDKTDVEFIAMRGA